MKMVQVRRHTSTRAAQRTKKRPKTRAVVSSEEEEAEKPITRKKHKVSQLTSFLSSFAQQEPDLDRKTHPTVSSKESSQEAATEEACDQWVDKYAPKDLSSLALHGKKLSEVRKSLQEMLRPDTKTKLLILSGPSGCSKSSVVKLLAHEMIQRNGSGSSYVEWFNPPEQTAAQFEEFLGEAKYRTGKNISLVLIEELPNVFHIETREAFQRALYDWISNDRQLPPLVLLISEYGISSDGNEYQSYSLDNNYTVETILGKRISNHPSVKRIKFNPVNATLIKKTLKNIAEREKKLLENIQKSERDSKINELSLLGDIRSAISAFQFWARWRIIDEDLSIDMGNESTMSIFHGIGKCVYGTKQDEPENVTMEKIHRDFLNRSRLLRLGLLENYLKYFPSDEDLLRKAADLADGYSFADLIPDDSISLEIATRVTRDSLRDITLKTTHAQAGFNFPREWKVGKVMRQCDTDIHKYIEIEMKRRTLSRAFQDSNLLYGFYEPLINKNRSFKNKAKVHYLKSIKAKVPEEYLVPYECFLQERLGGPLQVIQVSSDIILEADTNPVNSTNPYFATLYGENMDLDDDDDDGSEFKDDPIVDTDDESDLTFGDDPSLENALVNMSQRKKPELLKHTQSTLSQNKNAEFFDDFEDDFSD